MNVEHYFCVHFPLIVSILNYELFKFHFLNFIFGQYSYIHFSLFKSNKHDVQYVILLTKIELHFVFFICLMNFWFSCWLRVALGVFKLRIMIIIYTYTNSQDVF